MRGELGCVDDPVGNFLDPTQEPSFLLHSILYVWRIRNRMRPSRFPESCKDCLIRAFKEYDFSTMPLLGLDQQMFPFFKKLFFPDINHEGDFCNPVSCELE
ncbi:MAG: hypothetical protein A4E63_01341 [Syntrophorhabdus sp. PtaU1.Bin050]|nr:MAG: hypothetical protein A4E63_01341 [Syntrophorhabdus sp. PtaU1.Bin050]